MADISTPAPSVTLYKPGLGDSTISLTPQQLSTKITASSPSNAQIAANSGYIPTGAGNAPTSGTGFIGGTPANLYKPPVSPTPAPTPTLTSGAATNDVGDINKILQERQNLISQQQAQLQTQLQQNVAGINANFDQQQRALQATQGEESLTNQATQFRLGREATPYAQSAAEKLNQLHTQQISDLNTKRQDLINQANDAVIKGNYDLAKQLIDAEQQAFNDQQKIAQTQRQNQAQDIQNAINTNKLQTDQSQTAQSNLTTLAKSGQALESFSPDQKAQYEQQIGLPAGGFDAFYNAQVQAQQATTTKDQVAAATSIVSLLSKIPQGQSIQIGNATYTGIGGTPNTQIFQETAPNGTVTFVTVDKRTGDIINSASGGQIGKGFKGISGGGGGAAGAGAFNEKKAITAMTSQLKTVVGPDGYISPDNYTKARAAWISAGGNATSFDTKFKGYRNPNNPYYVTSKQPGA